MQLCLAVGLISACALCLCASADVSMLDAGELGGAAASLGVAHPSGFALDMLLLHAASLWPLGPLAFRQNLCVSLLASAAVSCVAYACLVLVRRAGWSSASAGIAAVSVSTAALLGSRTFLDASLGVEVYATSLLCVALAGVLVSVPSPSVRRAVWPLAGLALGAHITAPLLILPLVCVVLTSLIRRPRALSLCMLGAGSCAAILCYLPLASLHDGAFDWGDPETIERWLRHLSAARIREAYESSLFTGDVRPRLRLVEQLTEQPYWLPLALMGVIGSARQQRQSALVVGLVLCFDLAYASWINPMGVAQRQVGHASLAVIALYAGVGCGLLVEILPLQLRAAGRLGVVMISGACLWSIVRALGHTEPADGYAVTERYGAASPLSELAPRAVFVCETDTACASALFAIYAEGNRPDLTVVPGQHLWEPSVLRRLRGLPLAAASDANVWPAVAERASWSGRRRRELLQQAELRPVYFELVEKMPQATVEISLAHAPFIRLSAARNPSTTTSTHGRIVDVDVDVDVDVNVDVDVDVDEPLPHGSADTHVALTAEERARFGPAGPTTPLAKEVWASAHAALGALWLASDHDAQAVAELSRVVALTPLKAAARSNLGVALERRGDLHGALQQTAQAVELDPLRATPWVNLTRLLLRTQGPEAAREALKTAQRYEVSDPRLDALTRELQLPFEVTKGTTRK
jgi:hypothetical protein